MGSLIILLTGHNESKQLFPGLPPTFFSLTSHQAGLVARAKPKHQCDLRVDKGHEWIHALVLVWGKLTQKIHA
jgi:hypothetical protein